MARSKASVVRAAKANAVKGFSPRLAALRSEWRWATRDVLDDRVARVEEALGRLDQMAFELAQDVDSGRVELDLPDEPRPLFDRPGPEAPEPTALDRIIERTMARGDGGPIAEPDPLDSPAMDETPKHRYDVYLAAEAEEPREWIGIIESTSLVAARVQAPETYGPGFMPGTAFEVEPCKAHLDGRYTDVAECATCGRRWPADAGVGCPDCVHGPLPEIPPAPAGIAEDLPPDPPAKKPRPVPRKTFRVLYRHDDDADPIVLEDIKARDFGEAREALPRIYAGNYGTVRLPSGDVAPIDFDRVELVQVPAAPRKRKGAARA